jgi:hypothetical protein
MNFERNQMSQFPVELGLPQWLTHLANSIFEGLPKDEAPQFRKDLLAAIPVGLDLAIDLKPVRNKFLLAVQQRNLARLKNNEEPYAAECREAIGQVIEYLKNPNPESAEIAIESARSASKSAAAIESARSASKSAAKSTAWSAADSAAWSAAKSATADSAWSAAKSAAWAAWSTAWSAAARSASKSAAKSTAWSAADSAAKSATADSAWSAADSAAWAAWSTAWSAAKSAADSAWSAAKSAAETAWSAEYRKQRDDLLEIIRELTV